MGFSHRRFCLRRQLKYGRKHVGNDIRDGDAAGSQLSEVLPLALVSRRRVFVNDPKSKAEEKHKPRNETKPIRPLT